MVPTDPTTPPYKVLMNAVTIQVQETGQEFTVLIQPSKNSQEVIAHILMHDEFPEVSAATVEEALAKIEAQILDSLRK